jgi:hypothetical protein
MTATVQPGSVRPAVRDETAYENEAIDRVVDALKAEFAGRIPGDIVAETVANVRERFRDAKVREFVPLMVERRAHAKLTALAAHQS